MSHYVKDIAKFLEWIKSNLGKSDIEYDKDQFFGGISVFDQRIAFNDINLFVEFSKSGVVNLGKDSQGKYSYININFNLDNKYHNGFYFGIPYQGNGETAIKLWCYTYEDFSKLLDYFNLQITKESKDYIADLYKKSITKAGDNCNKLDVIYETIPDFVMSERTNEELYQALTSISNCSVSNTWVSALLGKNFDTDEEIAIINILKGFDKQWIYNKLNEQPELLENLLIHKIGFNSKYINKIIDAIVDISTANWSETVYLHNKYTILRSQKPDTEDLIHLPSTGLSDRSEVEGCYSRQSAVYSFGIRPLGMYQFCENGFERKALEPVLVKLPDNDQQVYLPAVVLKYYGEEIRDQNQKSVINDLLTIALAHNSLLSRVGGKGAGAVDEVVQGNRIREKLWTRIDERLGPLDGSIGTYYDIAVTYESHRIGVGASLVRDNILEFHLNIPKELQQQGLASEIIKRVIIEEMPSKVKGWWKKMDIYEAGESTNLTIFRQKLKEGLTPEAAALETPTGKIMRENGFGGKPDIIKNTEEEVIVHFNP